ncbi:MAG: amidohydrolase [Chitinophagaceae bacterium]|nr:MAG: amidohydrolase [Chitinophagaceae bacterium]
MKIDSHQHFWEFNSILDPSWINDSMSVLRQDFYPEQVKPLMLENGIEGCVVVQADQTEKETHYLLDLAKNHDIIKGVVGWVDFRTPAIEERLEYFSQFKTLKGFRHIVQAEKEDDFLLRKDFCDGISLLKKYNFTYDILIYPKHLKNAIKFVEKFPDQKFVIDHIAKPNIKDQVTESWKEELKVFGKYDNVYCKMAGLVTEADWNNWKFSDFSTYISITLDIFGTDRVMFGSDWPVCLPSASYSQVCEIVEKNTSFLNPQEKEKLWGLNCSDFYGL